MEVRDSTILEVLACLDELDEKKNKSDAAITRAHVHDDIFASMTPAQVHLMKRWHSYVCQKCGHTMIAKVTEPEDYP